ITVALANAAADLKKGNDIFKDEVIRQVKKIKKGNKKFQARTEAFLKEASAEMKEENNVFRKEMRAENNVFREETKAENNVFREEMRAEIVESRKEYDDKMVASRKEFREDMAASRVEFREDMAASRVEFKQDMATSRKEFREDMAAFQTFVGNQIKDHKQWTQWMIGITMLLLAAVNFLPLLFAPTENPDVVQVVQTENQHPQTKKELTQVQGQLTQVEGQLTQVQGQLTQVIEYLQASTKPGQPTPTLPTAKPHAK
ncbi:MAG: hypothetical protein K0U66_08415, partial [Gammaproteobacteria bacterium]|nr:hypothetical protein [Gammaproteobacteria bacterium]